MTPKVEAALGVAVILGGHYGLNRWEPKSIGYGMIADALFRGWLMPWVNRYHREQALVAVGHEHSPEEQLPPEARRVWSESEYLASVEQGAALEQPSGQALPDRIPLAASVAPTHIRLGDGREVTLSDYLRNNSAPVLAAIGRGRERARAARAAVGSVRAMSEADYLALLRAQAARAAQGITTSPGTDERQTPTHVNQIRDYDGELPLERYRVLFTDRVLQAGADGAAQGRAAQGRP
jgi:hypothetical protein